MSGEGPSLLSKAPLGHLLLKSIPLLLILTQIGDVTCFGPKSVVALLASSVDKIDCQETKTVYLNVLWSVLHSNMKKLLQDNPRGSPGDAPVTGRRRREVCVRICFVDLNFPLCARR